MKKTITYLLAILILITSIFSFSGCIHTPNYTIETVLPTCTQRGYDIYTCSCGRVKKTNYVKALGHAFGEYFFNDDAECEMDGTETAVCLREGCLAKRTKTKPNTALSHSFTQYLSDKNATETEDGTETAVCDRLNCSKTDTKVEIDSAFYKEPSYEPLYSFGVLSDVHLKDTNYGFDETYSLTDYQRALTYYYENGADFVSVAGDIVANNRSAHEPENESAMSEWVSELQIYSDYNERYFTNKPVYTIAGNHDATVYGHMNGSNGLAETVTVYGDGNMKAEEVWKDIIGTDLNFVVEHNGDVFIYFSMYYWNYVNFCRDQSDMNKMGATGISDIDWIRAQLEKYKNERVFLFFHLLLPNTFDLGSGLHITEPIPAGRSNDMKQLILNYPNVIWFSGHSHHTLEYEGEEGYDTPNLYQFENSMTMVHVPSCAYLRDEGGNSINGGSQGIWVDVYEYKVVIKGIDFTVGDGGELLPKVNYVISTILYD